MASPADERLLEMPKGIPDDIFDELEDDVRPDDEAEVIPDAEPLCPGER